MRKSCMRALCLTMLFKQDKVLNEKRTSHRRGVGPTVAGGGLSARRVAASFLKLVVSSTSSPSLWCDCGLGYTDGLVWALQVEVHV